MNRRSNRRAAWLLGTLVAGCDMTESELEPDLETTVAEINNGTVWNPWTQSTQTWTRNVVRVGGCTGTLLDYEWVLTAGHCFGGPDVDPATIMVTHRLADGSTEASSGVELLYHPNYTTEDANVDVALVRLARPLSPGVATLPIVSGSTADLIGDTVFCAGYGAIDTAGSCQTSSDCNNGWFCRWSTCMQSTDGDLRTAWLTITEDPVNNNVWYRFAVPNALGQHKLPGDSGSSCWHANGGLTGIHKAGNAAGTYNRDTSGPAARAWIQSIVTPTLLGEVNRPGAYCRGDDIRYGTGGSLYNPAATSRHVICPITRPVTPAFADTVSVPRLWVIDRSSTDDVCCTLQSKNAGGALTASETVCSEGNTSAYQTLVLPSVRDPYSFSHASIACSVPAATASGNSQILGYRTRLSDR